MLITLFVIKQLRACLKHRIEKENTRIEMYGRSKTEDWKNTGTS
jgi:hypothetical protein